jgi:hypothetical protein
LAEAFAEDDDAMPLGPFDAVAAVVFPALAGGDDESDDCLAGLGRAHLGVATEVADQLHAVEIAGHIQFLLYPSSREAACTAPASFPRVRSTKTGIRTARPRALRLARERSDTGAREPEALGLIQSGDAVAGRKPV